MHRRLAVRGLVQGVGFRPWVWQRATALGLIGWVRNTGFGVEIDLHGDVALLDAFQALLWQAPAPAKVEQVEEMPLVISGEAGPVATSPHPFEIQASLSGTHARATTIGTDLSVCTRCLSELFDPLNRRWRHPFIHCPQCGPRYTVTRSLPFDRAHTSMGRFLPCAACEAEYVNDADRRFHHQTNACPACGPRLRLRQADGSEDSVDPIAATLSMLRDGGIVALKSLGGFHLCCDARQPGAVARLRHRKRREAKPLAVMMANLASVQPWAQVQAHEQRWLQSSERPIVLLQQTAQAQTTLPYLAPGLAWLGVMLPYTATQYLLFHEACGRPHGGDWLTQAQDLMLVMTSANVAGAPLVMDNDTALLELAELADAWLLHDRDILARNEDSVLRVRPDGSACFMRRGRGYAPAPLALPDSAGLTEDEHTLPPSVLAMGALLKSTLCITQGDRALVSPHVGDLDSVETRVAYTRLADVWPAWLNTQPDAVACDLHPDFFSTMLAAHLTQNRASTASGVRPLPLIQVQHHHAHIAAVLAEHGGEQASLGPIIGMALDGHGLGSDGQVWGGELMRVEADQVQRLGHLLPMPLPGAKPSAPKQAFTTSLGRLFDIAAGLLDMPGPDAVGRYEAEAAMRLESLALASWPAAHLGDGWAITADLLFDWRPLVNWLADQTGAAPSHRAAVFHATLAAGLADWAHQACLRHDVSTVVLAGGCMANRLLDDALSAHLQTAGLKVWRATQYPCGDGGISLGQAWVARQKLLRQPR